MKLSRWKSSRVLVAAFMVASFAASTLTATLPAPVRDAHATPTEALMSPAQPLHWRLARSAAVNGVVDSVAVLLGGLTPDTTFAIRTSDFDWSAAGAPPAAGLGLLRVFLTSLTPTSGKGDTAYFAIDGSFDGTHWPLNGDLGVATATTGVQQLIGTANDTNLTGLVLFDADLQGSTGVSNVWMMPFVRFRFRAQNSSKMGGAQLNYVYLKQRLSQ